MKEDAGEFRRRRAIELLMDGESATDIAHFLGVTRQSVYDWARIARNGGDLSAKPMSGRPRRLSSDQVQELEQLLLQGATAHGWCNDLWTTPRVIDVIASNFNVTVSQSTAWRILRHSLNWTSQQPTTIQRERDERKIKRWREKTFAKIRNAAVERGAHLVFADEAGFMLMPSMRKSFAPRGQTPVIEVSDPHGRISTACAVTLSPKCRRRNLFFRLLPDNANYTGHSIAAFVRQLHRELNTPFTLIWDSIPIHRARPVREYVKQHPEIQLEMIPEYAPELNVADGVWAYIKYGRLANYAPRDLSELRKKVTSELSQLRTRTDLLMSFVRKTPLQIKMN